MYHHHSIADVIIKLASEGGLKWIYHLMQCEQPQVIAEGLMAINIILVQHPGRYALLDLLPAEYFMVENSVFVYSSLKLFTKNTMVSS